MSRTWRVVAVVAATVLALGLAAVGGFVALGGLDRWRDSQAIVIPEQYRPVIKEAAKRCKAVPA
ncbi:MAG: hypothetical protein ACKOAW_03990, partial [Actinomycetota bacterium]